MYHENGKCIMIDKTEFEKTILNLSKFHREHEKFYAQNPLEQANRLQFISRILTTLADRWSQVKVQSSEKGNPYIGCEDLNDTSTVAYVGVLFMKSAGEPLVPKDRFTVPFHSERGIPHRPRHGRAWAEQRHPVVQ